MPNNRRTTFRNIERILACTPPIDREFGIGLEEFIARQQRVTRELARCECDLGLAFSDEHFDGDVPYLAGNTNIQIEQVAGLVGRGGMHVLSGTEGCLLLEQLAARSGSRVHRTSLLKLANQEYSSREETLDEVAEQAAGRRPTRIGLLTPRQIIPATLLAALEHTFGAENVVDCQRLYRLLRYEKSDNEMTLLRDASTVADAMMLAMLSAVRPGAYETQVAAAGYFVAYELGAEQMGWDVIVGANTSCRTVVGKALNRRIEEGDYVHLGVAPKRDGLTACARRSCVAAGPSGLSADQRYWFEFLEDAYVAGLEGLREAARGGPACIQETRMAEFFDTKRDELLGRFNIRDPHALRAYGTTTTHGAGYTECHEFHGSIHPNSHEPLGHQIVIMLDVALRGFGATWNDVLVPGLDYLVLENTCGKYGEELEELTKLPYNVRRLVGTGCE